MKKTTSIIIGLCTNIPLFVLMYAGFYDTACYWVAFGILAALFLLCFVLFTIIILITMFTGEGKKIESSTFHKVCHFITALFLGVYLAKGYIAIPIMGISSFIIIRMFHVIHAHVLKSNEEDKEDAKD